MELSAVCELGKKRLEDIINKNGGDVLELFVENPNDNGIYNTVLEITLNKDFDYIGINIAEFRKDFILKYLYKKGATNGADYTPTARLTAPEKTFNKKILKCLEDTIKEYKEHKEIDIIKRLLDTLKDNQEKIINDIKGSIDSKNKYILTVKYDEKYIGEFEIFKDKVKKQAIKSYYLIDKKESKGKNKRCSICKEEKEEVFGNANIFKFYTVDKRGYVAGGFKKLDSWRNFPVCEDCAINLELGKKYLDENLKFKFQGRDFYLIPKLLYKKNLDKVLKTLTKLDDRNIDDRYENAEDVIIKRLSKVEDYATFDMFFFEVNNSALNIKLNVQEILPSRFRKIYENMTKINSIFSSSEISENIKVNFSFLNTLFPRKTYNRYFLETIDIILSDKEIDYKFIISHICNHIIEKFNQDEGKYFYYETIKSYGFLMYLRLLGVLFKEKRQVKVMEKMEWNIANYNSKEELFENLFNENMDFFTTPDKKAVFLLGFLAQKLLNLQYAKEKRKPFINRLKGLRLSKKDIKRLLPEIQNKFIEYDAEYYRDIQALASKYLLEAGEKWTISELDIPFYFSLGMNLERHIILTDKEEDEDD
ncbi:CRISPR-associated protein Csh1 [Caloranaerobacter azorensis DSM 13643]|uniref:CRISPR-associated protein Csh1 n=1 Tax=Caloranaerobacter azorensis DSM 13643 TaxID=1121264 RepID=A0A1M5UHJ4_9FIRM|nr:TIGR02556 family CRISPR-associated protein [Caloranaerobacter azorensis]SHH62378.1 CRISPR-associated protein Csh1 [Caloranaerobacter azorensis DSM 13643]